MLHLASLTHIRKVWHGTCFYTSVMIAMNHMSSGTAAKANARNNADKASPAGDFSAEVNKLFNPVRDNSRKSSADTTLTRESRRSKSAGREDSPDTPRSASDVMPSSTPVVSPAPTQLAELHRSGARFAGTVAGPDDSSNATSAVTLESASPLSNSSLSSGSLGNGSFGNGSLNNGPAGNLAHRLGLAGLQPTAVGDAKGLEVSPQLDETSGDLSPLDPTGAVANRAFGPSQDDTDVASFPQQPSAGIPVSETNVTELAALPADAPSNAGDASGNAPSIPVAAPGPVTRAGHAGTTQATAPKLSTKDVESAQDAPAPVSQMSPGALSKTAHVAGELHNHAAAVNSGMKASAFKQSEKATTPTLVDRDASLQSSLENGGPSSLTGVTGNGLTAGDTSSAQQDGDGSSQSDRHSKDEAVTGVVSMATPLPTAQNMPAALHLAGAPTIHSVQDHAAPASSSPAFADNTSTKLADLDPSAAADVKTVINTSKLLQTLHQSEMRVGMRSSEFGDISIRTSATHDNLLTQISLDHAELAKSLATHIPEMQARLAGHGNHEVRIHSDQNAAADSTMSDARSGSHGRQQEQSSRPHFAPSYGASNFLESAMPTAAMANNLQNAWQNGRLDIQA